MMRRPLLLLSGFPLTLHANSPPTRTHPAFQPSPPMYSFSSRTCGFPPFQILIPYLYGRFILNTTFMFKVLGYPV